jgi:hypothetical protein
MGPKVCPTCCPNYMTAFAYFTAVAAELALPVRDVANAMRPVVEGRQMTHAHIDNSLGLPAGSYNTARIRIKQSENDKRCGLCKKTDVDLLA